MNREMQTLIAKKATFREGISKLLELRKSLFEQITQIVSTFPEEAFYQMPFAGTQEILGQDWQEGLRIPEEC